jgi:hypothetical protein
MFCVVKHLVLLSRVDNPLEAFGSEVNACFCLFMDPIKNETR